MVRYDNLWEKFANFGNFYDAFLEARKGKKYSWEALAAGEHIEEVIWQMLFDLNTGNWRPRPYRKFICRTEVKQRLIHAPAFEDRILHHALCRTAGPLFEKKFIHDSYACRAGKGTHMAQRRLQQFMRRVEAREGRCYVLQCDVHHYFASIDHGILLQIICRTIKDRRLLEVWERLIDGFAEGIPIGALTSQLAANVYLNVFDHFVKEDMGVKHYLRYMDDFLMISADKQELRRNLSDACWFLESQLRLRLNGRTKLMPASNGVDFCGYRTFPGKTLPRKRNLKAAKRRFRRLSADFRARRAGLGDVRARLESFLGYTRHCSAWCSTNSVLRHLILRRN